MNELKAETIINAGIRIAEKNLTSAYIVKRGDEQAGAIFVKIDTLDGFSKLFSRNIKYDLKICCFSSNNWIGNGLVIPAGPLREKINSLKNFDIVFLNGPNINNESINAVIICSPTATHYNLIIDCLNKNKHVFVEKPLSLDVEEIKTCYNLARRKNLKLLVGYNRRFDNKILSLKNGINNIGKVNYVLTISRDYPYPKLDYLKIS